MLPWILDGILVIIIIGVCVNSYIQGLLVSLFNLLSSLIAIVISFILYPFVAQLFEVLPVYGWIKDPIVNSLTKISAETGSATAESLLKNIQLPQVLSDRVINQIDTGSIIQSTELIDKIGDIVTSFILQALSIVLLFIIVKLLLLFFKNILKGISKLPIIHSADKAGGLALGVIEAFVILTVAGAIFVLFSSKVNGDIIAAVENSVIAKFFYNDNILIGILSDKL